MPEPTQYTPQPFVLTLTVPLEVSAEDVSPELLEQLTQEVPTVVGDALAQMFPGRPIQVSGVLSGGVVALAVPDPEA